MHFKEEHAGKWVATKNHKVVDSSTKLKTLIKRTEKRKDSSEVRFAKVPKTWITGCLSIL